MSPFQTVLKCAAMSVFLTILIGCGGNEDPWLDQNTEGKADHKPPAELSWPVMELPLIECGLEQNDSLELWCAPDNAFKSDPLNTGNAIMFELRVKTAPSKVFLETEISGYKMATGIKPFSLKNVSGKVEVALTAIIPLVAKNESLDSEDTMEISDVQTLDLDDTTSEPNTMVLESPFKVWKLQLISSNIEALEMVKVIKKYSQKITPTLPDLTFTTRQSHNLNQWPEVFFLSPEGDETLSFQLQKTGTPKVSGLVVDNPGVWTVYKKDSSLGIRPAEEKDFILQ